MVILMSKQPSYVRCIKPNDDKRPGKLIYLIAHQMSCDVYRSTTREYNISSSKVSWINGESQSTSSWILLSKTFCCLFGTLQIIMSKNLAYLERLTSHNILIYSLDVIIGSDKEGISQLCVSLGYTAEQYKIGRLVND